MNRYTINQSFSPKSAHQGGIPAIRHIDWQKDPVVKICHVPLRRNARNAKDERRSNRSFNDDGPFLN